MGYVKRLGHFKYGSYILGQWQTTCHHKSQRKCMQNMIRSNLTDKSNSINRLEICYRLISFGDKSQAL